MLSIIILEDDAVSAALVDRIFTMNGHQARSASCIADAWRLLRETPADLLVLDTDLGGEWGWEMLERVRRSVVYRELPAIVYSAMWRRDIVRRYMLLGYKSMGRKESALPPKLPAFQPASRKYCKGYRPPTIHRQLQKWKG